MKKLKRRPSRAHTESFLRAQKSLCGSIRHKVLVEATVQITKQNSFMESSREPAKAFARQAMMCAARWSGRYSLEECAAMVGLSDHTTATWAVRKSKRNEDLRLAALQILELSEQMIKDRFNSFSQAVFDMEKDIAQSEKDDPETKPDEQREKSLRPNVEYLRRKAWEHDTIESKRIARLRQQRIEYYG